MKSYSFIFANLSEYQAIEQIVAQENLDFGRIYNFNLCCKEGFKAVTLTVDKDGTWAYVSNEMKGDYVAAALTVYNEDGRIEYREEILPRQTFKALKEDATNPRYDVEHPYNGHTDYVDLLGAWE